MEHDDQQEAIAGRYAFLEDKTAKSVFARLDYVLKSGMHIQRDHPKPATLYRFLEKHYDSLQAYYADYFEMLLQKQGEEWNTYYFIDFQEGSRGKVPTDPQYRLYMKAEYILIGLLFFKIFKLDGNIELSKISDFINLLYQEYDELVIKLQRVVSSLGTEAGTDFTEDKLTNLVQRAFSEFDQLGWISRDKDDPDSFTYQPSFERLRRMYYPQIGQIDELLKSNGHG